jgi:hypothetical protein
MSIQSKNSVIVPPGAARDPNHRRDAVLPTYHEHQLLLERRNAESNGYEVPLDSVDAAAYIGSSVNSLISLALAEEIPAHPVVGGSWNFYVSELNEWLAKDAGRAAENHPFRPHMRRETEHELR